jgi:RimJ/RimL family protein N-acetyltransferase
MVLNDGLVMLRPRTRSDVDAQIAGQDEAIMQWLDWDAPTYDNISAMVDASTEWWSNGTRTYDFGVCDAATGVLVGNALANCLDPLLEPGEVNVAYAVFPEWRGRGIAPRVVELLSDWLRNDLSVHTIVLKIDEENTASMAVARRLGFCSSGSIHADGRSLQRFIKKLRP